MSSSPSEVRPAPRLPPPSALIQRAKSRARPLQFVSPPLRPAGDRARLAAFEPCRDFEPRPAHLLPALPRRAGLILATGLEVWVPRRVFPFSVDGGRRSNERKHALAPTCSTGICSGALTSRPRPAAVPGAAIRRRRRDDPRTRFAPFASRRTDPRRTARRSPRSPRRPARGLETRAVPSIAPTRPRRVVARAGLTPNTPSSSPSTFFRPAQRDDRRDLVDWMSQQHSSLDLMNETLHLAFGTSTRSCTAEVRRWRTRDDFAPPPRAFKRAAFKPNFLRSFFPPLFKRARVRLSPRGTRPRVLRFSVADVFSPPPSSRVASHLRRHGIVPRAQRRGFEPVPALPLGPLESGHVLIPEPRGVPALCNKLERLGITCVFVAAKLTEVSAPSAHEFAEAAEVSTFTRSQLLLAERALLRELVLPVATPRPRPSRVRLSATLPAPSGGRGGARPEVGPRGDQVGHGPGERDTEMVDYLLETAAVSHLSLDFPPSLLAAARRVGVDPLPRRRVAPRRPRGARRVRNRPRHAGGVRVHRTRQGREEERKAGAGMDVNDEYPAATSCLWPNEDTDETR